MQKPHFFNELKIEWSQHPELPDIRIKKLETRETHSGASLTLVEVAIGGVISNHIHEKGTETAFVLSGHGVLSWGNNNNEVVLKPGAGVTIPQGISHSLSNTGNSPMRLLAVHIPPAW